MPVLADHVVQINLASFKRKNTHVGADADDAANVRMRAELAHDLDFPPEGLELLR